ncbi:NFACT RNA binding domain-containing protein [Lacticaseibacillus hulanensis]|uniref:NFACT RNA binding domain-containing protein n=1 Tax=Lacticaseibacillus hulanensis TaxID=2493111 RepID=UPI000FD85779|nr:NFACT RNA binding domain-containing protein [Lacticaseibacillus hulanensis]
MSFDGMFTHAMAGELADLLTGGRVMKVQQPYQNEIVLTIRARGKSRPLLLSANPQYARVQITAIPFANPAVPSNFTMTLRKYLAAATLVEMHQVGADRVLHLDFASRDELGDDIKLRLVVELMGRHSNITLVNVETGKILDLIRHVPADENRYRLLMPGADYVEPPHQDKLNPFTASSSDWVPLVDQNPDVPALAKAIQTRFQGFARDSAVELATRMLSGLPGPAWDGYFAALDQPEPTITTDKKEFFTATPYVTLPGERQTYPTLSAMLDAFYAQKAERARVNQVGSTVIRVLKNNIDRVTSKLKKLDRSLEESAKADRLRIRGEILTTYLNQVPRGATSVTLPNFYDDMKPMKIALSPELGPNQNAQKYFTRYQKLRNSVSHVHEQIAVAKEELNYLQGIEALVDLAAPKDLEDIKTELMESGYIRRPKTKGKKNKRVKVAKPDSFWASDGTHILVGKNNLQNDQLTLRTAAKDDIWLHAKDVPGSHVIIESNHPSDKTLLEAANLAAFFSRSQYSANVQVDYIQVKRIKKPNVAKPGYVIYTGQKTLAVTPDEALVNKMRVRPTI